MDSLFQIIIFEVLVNFSESVFITAIGSLSVIYLCLTDSDKELIDVKGLFS